MSIVIGLVIDGGFTTNVIKLVVEFYFFFSSRRRHTRFDCDWSSDVCSSDLIAKPSGRLELPRRIKPGSELVRTWKGKSYRVMVMTDGFAHDGRTFTSLSEIASEIAGTNWNGPRFFGLRSAVNKQATDGR